MRGYRSTTTPTSRTTAPTRFQAPREIVIMLWVCVTRAVLALPKQTRADLANSYSEHSSHDRGCVYVAVYVARCQHANMCARRFPQHPNELRRRIRVPASPALRPRRVDSLHCSQSSAEHHRPRRVPSRGDAVSPLTDWSPYCRSCQRARPSSRQASSCGERSCSSFWPPARPKLARSAYRATSPPRR